MAKEGPSEQERAEKLTEFLQEEVGKPMRYVFHDTDAHDSDELRQLRYEHGWEALGRWWTLVELLGRREWHRYDVRRPCGWRMLAEDLSFQSEDECREFVGWLLDLGLLHRESFEESGYVRSERIERNAYQMAENAAQGRLGTWVRYYGKHPPN